MHPYIGSLNIYDAAQTVAFALGAVYLWRALTRRAPFQRQKGRLLAVFVGGYIVSVYGGALIPFLWRAVNLNPASHYLDSGRYFHSVFLSMLAYVIVVCRLFRWPLGFSLDHFAIAGILMSAVGRVGCFFQGCCSGKPTDLPWGLVYPFSNGVPLHPTQLYMIGIESALAATLHLWVNRKKRFDGQTFWTAVWLYSIYRIWIEALRVNPIFVCGLTHAQSFSILTLALSSWVLISTRNRTPAAAAPNKRH